ncbi:MAG: YjjG family noncanonical pyrimidine nucleotidase [Prevotellaceae bacterium]|nr:YjjG family noncanonical pyrimidine nucleotidase [Prevotellaceae bacterium]
MSQNSYENIACKCTHKFTIGETEKEKDDRKDSRLNRIGRDVKTFFLIFLFRYPADIPAIFRTLRRTYLRSGAHSYCEQQFNHQAMEHFHQKRKSYKCVFLDLDDTIWDFHTNAKISLKEAFDDMGLGRFADFDVFFARYAKKNTELWELYEKNEITKDYLMKERFRYPLEKIGIEDDSLRKELGDAYLRLLPTRTTLMPHARELLTYLSEKYPLTIVSNGFVDVQYKKLNHSGISHFFTHFVFSEDAGALKPDKKIFEYALALNKARAEDAIMIGDNFEADIKGAMNAGIDQLFFNPAGKSIVSNHAPNYAVSSLKSIFEIL